MKAVLCSEGFSTSEIVAECVRLVGKPQDQIMVAVINEAYAVEQGDNRWVLDNLNAAFSNFPAYFELVNLLALSLEEVKQRIDNCDVIYVLGGHTDYLMSVFEKTGFGKLLPELLQTIVYVGSSAGSMVFGKRINNSKYQEYFSEGDDYGTSSYLGFVELAIKPHMDSEYFDNRSRSTYQEVSIGEPTKLYGLSDCSAVVVDGDDISVIGTNWVVYQDGKEIEGSV